MASAGVNANGVSAMNGHVAPPRAGARTIRIGTRLVGDGQPCFVLAEGGLNHNGDPALAEELVRIAVDARADAVKFQKRNMGALLTREALDAPYIKPNSFGATYGEHREKLELSADVWRRLRDGAAAAGLEFMGSAWDAPSVDFLLELGAPALKVASADLTSLDLLAYVAQSGVPVILSTGMSTLEEIDEAVGVVLRHTDQLILLQCCSAYPAEFEDLHLRVMGTYRERYGVLVGYSGHERGIAVAAATVALGACLLEKHFTKDRTLPGPDHAASLEPVGLGKLIRDIRNIETALGSSDKRVVPAELPVRAKLAKSVVARGPIRSGTRIDAGMLTAKGPGTGIAADDLARLVGRVAQADIAEDTVLPRAALDWPLAEPATAPASG